MYIGIYLIVGVAVLLIHRFTKDKLYRESPSTFIFLPELVLLLVILWPVYLVDLIIQFARAKKTKQIENENNH